MENFYLSNTIDDRGGAFDSAIITMIRNGWCNFKDSLHFLAGRGFPLPAKDRFCMCRTLYRSETWPVKEEDVIKLERNDVRMLI